MCVIVDTKSATLAVLLGYSSYGPRRNSYILLAANFTNGLKQVVDPDNFSMALLFIHRRRGRGILVAPGFCPACASRFLVGAKNSKTTGQFFFKFQHDIPSSMEMCKGFFKDATKIQNVRQRSTPKKFVGAKT